MMTSLQWEKYYPIIIGTLITGTFAYFKSQCTFIDMASLSKLYEATINVAAISVGFLATAKSILLSMRDSKSIKRLQQGTTNHYKTIVSYLKSAISFCLVLAVLSSLILIIKPESNVSYYLELFWLWLCVISILSCYRIISIFSMLLSSD